MNLSHSNTQGKDEGQVLKRKVGCDAGDEARDEEDDGRRKEDAAEEQGQQMDPGDDGPDPSIEKGHATGRGAKRIKCESIEQVWQ